MESKAEETTESGNAQCILTIFMKFGHLYNTVRKYQDLCYKLVLIFLIWRAFIGVRKKRKAKETTDNAQCILLSFS